MNAFEYIVSELLHERGYWTRVGYRLTNLTREDKHAIGKPSLPRPELDIVAFNPRDRELLIVECKSFLDSTGVRLSHFDGTSDRDAQTFKLFNFEPYQSIVKERLVEQMVETGLLHDSTITPRLAVAAGKIRPMDAERLPEFFEGKGWQLITPSEIAAMVRKRANKGYEDETMTVVAKLLERNPPSE
ncbi:MAG: hypothetical protein AAF357_04365 [Verrucomicrobiota bacterium]